MSTSNNTFAPIKFRGGSVSEVFRSELKQHVKDALSSIESLKVGRLTSHQLLRDGFFLTAKAISKSKHADKLDACEIFIEIITELFGDLSKDESDLLIVLTATFSESYDLMKKNKCIQTTCSVLSSILSSLL